MSFQFIAAGASASGFNASISPVLPSASPGDLFLLFSTSYQGSLATPAVADASGNPWTLLSASSSGQVGLWGKVAVGGDQPPIVTWGNQYSVAWVNTYRGQFSPLSGIVHASNSRTSNSTNFIAYGSLGITAPGCLVIACGSRDKTSTSDSGAFNSLSGFTLRNSAVHAGTAYAAVLNDQIQTTQASIAAQNQTFNVADSSATQFESLIVALLPASIASYALNSDDYF